MSSLQAIPLWSVEHHEVADAAPVARVRRGLLGLYPCPALFETGAGFLPVDGNQTTFMIDLLLEFKLVNGAWHLSASEPFEWALAACEQVLNDPQSSLCERLRRVAQTLALPEGFPLVLALGYSAARFVENLPGMAIEQDVPEVLVRVYRHVVRYEAPQGPARIDVLNADANAGADLEALFEVLRQPPAASAPGLAVDSAVVEDVTDREGFCAAVSRAKEYIRSGDIYQVQLCRRAVSNASIAPVDLYERLASVNPAPYMYYLDLADLHVVSSSPELMIRLQDGVAQVRPIAGTMSRGDLRGNALDKIPKEAAEHLMLVDLARNDLARCAVPGGVQVSSFMQQDTYGSLLHLVSTVETRVREHCDVWDLIVANFPAGTMTGAPKVRAMEIIAELEGTTRGLYTGCAGYITGANSAVLALTIRTIVGNAGHYVLQAAAGVVADSRAEDEWNEAGAKIRSFSRAMGACA
ncbi:MULTISPECIES: anthranilate synthase component I family protein [unclassified Pseudomonas]|uniref:anthranilate synthase component I family protein n=1 Tax=unclassified Pseudomonas TaxID=196821 RepID=UPI000838201C|nr:MULTISPECIES: anthranilate synthase component I family protein [unclassified Pseudomonas]QIH08010.1 anthranilate synthase component I family protein [Pseudomonas sp. BIOMIG1BAC]